MINNVVFLYYIDFLEVEVVELENKFKVFNIID